MINKLTLALIFLGVSGVANAKWVYFASTSDMDVYISEVDLSRSKSTVKAWDLAEFKNPIVTGTKAQETFREFDCNKRTSKIIKMKTYDKNGKLTDNYGFLPDWHSKPKSGTMADALIKAYCN
jgi:hypothetical protein